jgi:hypothetical protein
LIVNGAKYFDSGNTTRRAFFACDWPPAGAAASYTPNRTPFKTMGNQLEQGWMAGGMCPIPAGYQASLKGDTLSGNSNLPIISRGSQGPCATAFYAQDVIDKDPIPCTTLVGYPATHHMPEHPYTSVEPDDIYNQNTLINGVSIIGDTVVFVGSHGFGPACYGIGSDNQADHEQDINGEHYCYDPSNHNHGTHAYPYRMQVWHYPVSELVRVANGECAPWDLRPEWFELTIPFYRADFIGGACAYDEATKRLYVPVYAADGYGSEPGPVIYVYEYDGSAQPPVVIPPTGCATQDAALASINVEANTIITQNPTMPADQQVPPAGMQGVLNIEGWSRPSPNTPADCSVQNAMLQSINAKATDLIAMAGMPQWAVDILTRIVTLSS